MFSSKVYKSKCLAHLVENFKRQQINKNFSVIYFIKMDTESKETRINNDHFLYVVCIVDRLTVVVADVDAEVTGVRAVDPICFLYVSKKLAILA